MYRRPSWILAAVTLVVLGLVPQAQAQLLSDRGKKKLPKLFAEVVTPVTESTVRLQVDGKDAILGTVVETSGLILTKGSELLKDGEFRGTVTCLLNDGTEHEARMIGYHRESDLLLVKIDAKNLKAVQFTEVTNKMVGNWVAAVGTNSEPVAVGVLSAPVRKLSPDSEEGRIENSNKGYLGIALLDAEEGEGVIVGGVSPGAAAAKAGLKAKDIIYELAGKAVKNRETLIRHLENYRPGDTVTLRLKRGEEEISLKVKLGSKNDFDRSAFQNSMGSPLSNRRTGFPAILQHDMVLKPTDCGGPLVDLDGKVLGINIARAGRVESWALTSDVITPILKQLKEGKTTSISK